jgi:hypothetical protein
MKTEAPKTHISLGRTVITANAMVTLDHDSVQDALRRHAVGDWGDLSPEDRQENDLSARAGFRILSAYTDTRGTKFWIITETDRSATTVLLPEDY